MTPLLIAFMLEGLLIVMLLISATVQGMRIIELQNELTLLNLDVKNIRLGRQL